MYKITCGVEPLTDSRATRFRTYPPLHPLPGYLALSTFPSRYPVLLLTFHLSRVTLILWPRDNLLYRLATLFFHLIRDSFIEFFTLSPWLILFRYLSFNLIVFHFLRIFWNSYFFTVNTNKILLFTEYFYLYSIIFYSYY